MKKIFIFGIMVLFLLMTVSSANMIYLEKQTIKPMSFGNTLYVGGSGPNNYTKIQDAIDDASEGDTIFVYDDSSPYNESVIVYKSLILKGENKLTTIIDRNHMGQGFLIITNNVTIEGFTIQETSTGVYISGYHSPTPASYTTVSDNIIIYSGAGIDIFYPDKYGSGFTDYGHNTIIDNIIMKTTFYGIRLVNDKNTSIFKNNISETEWSTYGYGILAINGKDISISNNNIFNNKYGIAMSGCDSIIYRNNIENNGYYGLYLEDALSTEITENNFIVNRNNIMYTHSKRISCNANYWDDWIGFRFKFLNFLPYRIPTILFLLKFDWNPAQEPYDIEV